jgi:hypothetical protein
LENPSTATRYLPTNILIDAIKMKDIYNENQYSMITDEIITSKYYPESTPRLSRPYH